MSDSEESQYEQMVAELEAAYNGLAERVAHLKAARAGIAKIETSNGSAGTVLTVSCDSLGWADKKPVLKTVSFSETVPNGKTPGGCGGVTGISKTEKKESGDNIYTIGFTDRKNAAPKGKPGALNDYWSADGGRYKASVTLAGVSATGLKGSVTGVSIGATGLSCSVTLVKLLANLSYTSLAFVDSSLTVCDLNEKITENDVG